MSHSGWCIYGVEQYNKHSSALDAPALSTLALSTLALGTQPVSSLQ